MSNCCQHCCRSTGGRLKAVVANITSFMSFCMLSRPIHHVVMALVCSSPEFCWTSNCKCRLVPTARSRVIDWCTLVELMSCRLDRVIARTRMMRLHACQRWVSRHVMQLCSLVHVQIDQHFCQLSRTNEPCSGVGAEARRMWNGRLVLGNQPQSR